MQPPLTNLNFDELKDKPKEELERIKLAQEITGFKEARAFESKKFTAESGRLIIIASLSAFISLLSLGTSIWMKYLDKNTSQTDGVRKHIDVLKDRFYQSINTSEQKNIACQIASERNPNNDNDVKTDILGFAGKCDTLTQLLANNMVARDSLHNITVLYKPDSLRTGNNTFIKISDKSDLELNKLQNQKIAASNDVERQAIVRQAEQFTQKFINNIPDSLLNLKSAVRLTDTIHNNIVKQANITTISNQTSDNRPIIKDYGTSWFKTGYFLQFDGMRVLLQYQDKQLGIQVQICQTTNNLPCANPLKNKEWISYDNPMTVRVGDADYRIQLQTIDHAGNNPFKLAAYISVLKLGN